MNMLRKAAIWVALFVVMAGCTAPKVPTEPPQPPPGQEQDTASPSTPPAAAESSPVTWAIESLDDSTIKAPMSVRLSVPHRFRIRFSASVDQESVQRALEDNLGPGTDTFSSWDDDRTITFVVNKAPVGDPYMYLQLSPHGGKDADGKKLVGEPEAAILLSFGHHTSVWRWAKGDRPALVDVIAAPFDVLSVSPDGQNLLLRRSAIRSVGGFPPVGPPFGYAYWYHWGTQRLVPLDVGIWLSPQWLPDGSLVVSGNQQLVHVSPAGTVTTLVTDRRVVNYTARGTSLAVFLDKDIWIFDTKTRQRSLELKDAYTPALSPNGVAQVKAIWSPDGKSLLFSDRTNLPQDDSAPDRLALLTPGAGARSLTESAFGLIDWSADGKLIFAGGVGLLAPDGKVVRAMPEAWKGVFSPKADRLYVPGKGIVLVGDGSPVGKEGLDKRNAAWSPDGKYVATWDGPGWAVYTASGAPFFAGDTMNEQGWPEWSSDSQFLAIPGVGVVDTWEGKLNNVDPTIGVSVGWNQNGALFLAPGRHAFDYEYVR